MGRKDRLFEEFMNAKIFDYNDFVTMMGHLGYIKIEKEGSRVQFYNKDLDHMVHLHSPHPQKELKPGVMKAIKKQLETAGIE